MDHPLSTVSPDQMTILMLISLLLCVLGCLLCHTLYRRRYSCMEETEDSLQRHHCAGEGTTLPCPVHVLSSSTHSYAMSLQLIPQARETQGQGLDIRSSCDAGCQQEDEDDEQPHEELEQTEHVSADEAQHHDDHADGDEKVDAGDRHVRDLEEMATKSMTVTKNTCAL
ncbi:hypothetical protein JZ751_016730 [Albula glossodonta]|uniref:Uncharacterized protein n=1 Tax=Albula glossodonta TaxID=121402 RepID=A0A8T2NXS1_9TELE|nr:hypothetical protein JZ751_016730 [Albula glossodonta]